MLDISTVFAIALLKIIKKISLVTIQDIEYLIKIINRAKCGHYTVYTAIYITIL